MTWQLETTTTLSSQTSEGTVSLAVSYFTQPQTRPQGEPDKIGLRSFMLSKGKTAVSPPCLFLPGRFANSNIVFHDSRYDFRQHLAAAGYPVYSFDYRPHFLIYDEGPEQQRFAAWDTGVFLQDIAQAVYYIRQQHQGQKIVLIGHSMGCTLAYLYAAAHSHQDLCGLIALDGGVRSPPTLDKPSKFDFGHERQACQRQGQFVSQMFGDFQAFKAKLRQAMSPHQPPTRYQHLLRTYLAQILDGQGQRVNGWPRGTMSNISGGIGDLDLLLPLLESHDGFWPLIQVLEARAISYGITHPQLPDYGQGLEEIDVPLLNIVALGRGDTHHLRNLYSAQCTQSPLTEVLLADFGHMDVVVCPSLQEQISQPIQTWLQQIGTG